MPAYSGTVLVAEPDAPVRMMLHHLLSDAGYHVLACAEAADCYRLVRDAHPLVALVDVSGRGRDAFWLAVLQLHSDAATRHTPLMLMTTNVAWLTDAEATLKAMGVRAFSKPFDTSELLAAIATALRPLARRNAAPELAGAV